MKRRTIMFTALLVLVLILSGCSSLTGNSVISTVSVSASASKEVAPDTATFSITAESTKPSTEEARNDSATMINKAVEILKDGKNPADIPIGYLSADKCTIAVNQETADTLGIDVSSVKK